MREIVLTSLQAKSAALTARAILSGALSAGAIFLSGCAASGGNGHDVLQTAALAQPLPTPTVRPVPTPRPTAIARGIALFKVKTTRKVFALTFDDGPDPTYTPQVLKILKQKNVPATFFMVGKMVRAHGSTGKLVVQAGYPIGSHTWTHPKHPKSPSMEIERTDAEIKKQLGITPRLFRPPYGIRNNGLASLASARGEDVIIWSSDSDDWNHSTSAARIYANVMKNARAGGIALMHDGGGNRSQTVAALPGIIDELHNRGFELVTVPELMALGKPETARIGGATKKAKH